MYHDAPLIAAIVFGLGLAFVFGTLANKLRVPPLVGYLLAGILVGPHTPGFVADQNLAFQLAEIGIILLMFGVGLHFSLKDLLSVRSIAIPGALAQIIFATFLGMIFSWFIGWSFGAGLVFGLALSVASTAVLLRALQEQRLLETERGRIAVGWLIVEDLVMVFVLVLLPTIAQILATKTEQVPIVLLTESWSSLLTFTIAKVAAFILIMLIIGRRLIPWILHYVAHTESQELFRLGVLVIALGVAFGAANLFGVSLALGAFFAGMIMSESELSQRAAEESLPLRDAFSVLFFVSVGMLFDPSTLMSSPGPVVWVLLIILLGKSIIAFLIVIAFGYSLSTALTISASLAQIGEFSFILADLGKNLHILPEAAQDLIVAGAILSILINPIIFLLIEHIQTYFGRKNVQALSKSTHHSKYSIQQKHTLQSPISHLKNHTILVGYGRVGNAVGNALLSLEIPFIVIEDNEKILARLHKNGIEAIEGNGAHEITFALTNPSAAHQLILAIHNSFEAGQIILRARAANPNIFIISRAHSLSEYEHLKKLNADIVILEETEIARGMIQKIKTS